MSFVNILGAALFGMVLAVFLRQYREEYALFVSFAVSIGLLSASVALMLPILEYVRGLSDGNSFSSYIDIIFKACAIGLLTKLASELCKDAGENAISQKVELVGKCALLLCAFPVLQTILEQAKSFMK